MTKKITIAVDGFSACGKSTLARDLARKLDYLFVDSGAMYRAVSLYALRQNLFSKGVLHSKQLIELLNSINLEFRKVNNLPHIFLNGRDVEDEIRTNEVAKVVSLVSAIKEVREKLVVEQRKMAVHGGIVMDGRDIGTVVFPNAELKLFVTANVLVRTQRRLAELKSKGIQTNLEEVKLNLEERDFLDTTRKESPLKQAEDAVLLDNSNMTKEEQLSWVMQLIKSS